MAPASGDTAPGEEAASGGSVAREAAAAYPATVGVRELRQNLSVYLDEVKQGRSLIVTEHGRQVALLRPLPASLSTLERLVHEGRATAPRRPLGALGTAPELALDRPLSAVLVEMRAQDPW